MNLAYELSFREWQAKECQNHILDSIGGNYSLQMRLENKKLEVRPVEITKKNAIRHVLSGKEASFDFIFCSGDDRTDKDLFEYLYSMSDSLLTCILCTVNTHVTKANYYADKYSDLISILNTIANDIEPTEVGKSSMMAFKL